MTSEVWVHCKDCRHGWVLMHLPMPVDRAVKVMKQSLCPKCGGKNTFMGKAPDLSLGVGAPAAAQRA